MSSTITSGNPQSEPGTVSFLDPWAQGVPYQALNDAVMQATIVDEYGKLNLNALIDRGTDKPREELEKILRAFFKIRKVDQDPTDAIIDWLDANNETQGNGGARSDYYQSISVPYACKNGPMASIEELLLIKGITQEVYFGNPDLIRYPCRPAHGAWPGEGLINANTAGEDLIEAIGERAGWEK